jgi:hypothetical protein
METFGCEPIAGFERISMAVTRQVALKWSIEVAAFFHRKFFPTSTRGAGRVRGERIRK